MADDHEHLFPPEPEPRRRAPAGRALAVVLVALLVGALFNADSLHQTAEAEPIGSWQRTWAMRVTGPLRSLSDATVLNRPRKWLADGTGHGAEPPPLSTKTVVTAPPAPVSTTTTAPPPARVPTAADPVRILVAGDSLMGWIGPSLAKAFDGQPVEVDEDWKAATSLARPDYVNWPVRLKQGLKDYDPEVLVIGFGGNDSQGMTTADGVVAQHTDGWRAEYQRRVAQLLDIAEKKGRTVYWLGAPLTTSGNIEKTWPDMEQGIKAEIAARPWAHFVDTRSTLTPNGRYTAYLPDESGKQVKVRENDGVHPTPRGAEFEVAPLAADLRKERNLR